VAQPEPTPFRIPAPAAPTALAEGAATLARVPAAFVPNLGQWEHPARFVARIGGTAVFLEEGGFASSVPDRGGEGAEGTARGATVRMRFAGAGPCEIVGEEPLAGVHAYFLGNDPASWKTGVPRFGAVRYRGAWPGVEVRLYEKEGHLEYDLVVSPGASLAAVEFTVEGAEGLCLDEEGTLVLETAVGALRQPRAKTFEVDASGRRRELSARYEVRGRDRFGFVVPEWAGESGLVVDPGLLWSTFVGAGSDDIPNALAVDASGVVTIAGYTSSPLYPTTPGAWDTTYSGTYEIFVTRLDPSQPPSQQLLYSTFVGGDSNEWAYALSGDASGVVTVAGTTTSSNYPTTPGAWDTTYSSPTPAFDGDVFVTRLDLSQPSSQQILYSTYVGATDDDTAFGVSADPSGVVTIAGWTSSPNYPTTPGAWDTTHDGIWDVFVTCLDPSQPSSQQLLYSTFVGGADDDNVYALAVDASGVVTIAGRTFSADYPTTPGGWDTTYDGPASSLFYGGDAFATRLDPSQPSAQQLLYSTFVGGSATDLALALSVDAPAVVTIAGWTTSADYPTTPGAWDWTYNGPSTTSGRDVFVTRLDPTQPSSQQLLYSTFVGGAGNDDAFAVSVDPSGVVTIAGRTTSAAYPTTPGAWDTTYNGAGINPTDVFVTRLDPSQPSSQQLLYSTFVGGSAAESASSLSVGASGVVTIAGSTRSAAYPTTPGAWDTTYYAGEDVFVTRLDMLPTGASAYGDSTPGCAGPLAIGVTSIPQVGNAAFALTCWHAPVNATGLLAFSSAGLATPFVFLGASVWLDLASPAFFVLPVPSNAVGAAQVGIPIPANPALAGGQAFVQFFWAGPSSPSPPCPPLGVSASAALAVTIQP
ncbi:MAG: hypothetical protein L0323_15820, partial [Planctomycetes bacterium]|nr:hypothetical protein [Planctomycetota bacterium]